MPGRHGHSDGKANKQDDDHPNPVVLSLRAKLPSASFRMGNRDILDQESGHIDAGIQHHPDSQAHNSALKSHTFR
jgi:hypothetical protein